VFSVDNEELCAGIPYWIERLGGDPETALGSILIDPNGPAGIPWKALKATSRRCPGLTIMMNYPKQSMVRSRTRFPHQYVSISDLKKRLHRQTWGIKEMKEARKWAWIVGINNK
jgi:hypothetical protein